MAEEKGPDIMLIVGVLAVIILGALIMSMGPNFTAMISNLQGAGFFSYMLPFLLVFAVVYAFLRMTKIVDDLTALIIALVIGLFSIVFFSTVPIVGFLAFFLGRIGIVLVIIMVVYMFYAYMTRSEGKEEKKK
jgi:hypothetical protein